MTRHALPCLKGRDREYDAVLHDSAICVHCTMQKSLGNAEDGSCRMGSIVVVVVESVDESL